MRLICVRHGETIENAAGMFQGSSVHCRLSKKGVEQTKRLGRALAEERIDAVYASPLDRARKTLDEIIRYHPNLRPTYLAELKERGKGVLEGRRISDVVAEDPRILEKLADWSYVPHGGESLNKVRRRARKFLKRIRKQNAGQTVLVVGHLAFNNALFSVLLDTSASFSQNNACINEFELGEKSARVIRINDVSHLR